jgi:rsbT co-antagonist protein RsbR
MATPRRALAAAPLAQLLAAHGHDIQQDWLRGLRQSGALDSGRIQDTELQNQCSAFLRLLRQGLDSDASDADSPGFAPLRDLLAEISRARAVQGISPHETAAFVFSLKPALFDAFGRLPADPDARQEAALSAGLLLDHLGLFTMAAFQKMREEVIVRQQQEIAELSTPVIKLWQGILALPLIGTLDSQRTQVVMENLLESIVAQGAEMAIIDITGVPTVDTLTAQHLLKTVAAARLMGADCIISGIRPQIAQTMVHLGVELSVVSKATLADAFALALARQGRRVVRAAGNGAGADTAGAAAGAPAVLR